MRRPTLAALATVIALGMSGMGAIGALAGNGTSSQSVTLLSVADYPPYNYLDDEGVMAGFEAELASVLCERANLDCSWALAPWDELIPTLLQGDADIIMSAFQITDARDLLIDFSDVYIPADPSAIVTLPGTGTPGPGAVVGALNGSVQAQYVTDQGWSLVAFDTPAEALEALSLGQISAFLADQAYLEQVVADTPEGYQLVETDIATGGGIALGLRTGDSALKATLNAVLASLKADGTLDALIGTWFDGRDPNYRGADLGGSDSGTEG